MTEPLPAPPQEWCDLNYIGVVSYITPAYPCYPKPYLVPKIGQDNPLAFLLPFDTSYWSKPDNNNFIPGNGIDAPTYVDIPSTHSIPKLDSPTPSNGNDVNKDCSINIPGCSKTIGEIAKEYNVTNVPDYLVAAMQEQESGRNPNVGCNYAGACGIGQIVPRIWAKKFGVTKEQLNDSCINTSITLRIMSDAIKRYGNIPDAIHDYYGWGTPLRGPSGSNYIQQVLSKQSKYKCETNIPDTSGSKSYGPLGAVYCPTSPKGIT